MSSSGKNSGIKALITGAASGIGKELARLFIEDGATVALLDINEVNLKSAADEFSVKFGGRVFSYRADTTDYSGFKTAVANAVADMGGLDVFINNAGIGVVGPFEGHTPDEMDSITRVNYLGMVYGSHIALGHFYPKASGHIVNVASGAGLQGFPLMALYCGAKGGIIRFSESLRFECRRKGIDISVALPSSTDTPMILDRLDGPDEAVPGILMAIPLCKTEDVAKSIVRGIRKKKFLIFPTFLDRMAYYGKRFMPGISELGISLIGFRPFRKKREKLMHKYGIGKGD